MVEQHGNSKRTNLLDKLESVIMRKILIIISLVKEDQQTFLALQRSQYLFFSRYRD